MQLLQCREIDWNSLYRSVWLKLSNELRLGENCLSDIPIVSESLHFRQSTPTGIKIDKRTAVDDPIGGQTSTCCRARKQGLRNWKRALFTVDSCARILVNDFACLHAGTP